MDSQIALCLVQDGLTNGAVYALLGIATVLVFAVTRVIFVPQGEFVTFGALTLALLQANKVPGSIWLLLCIALAVSALEAYKRWQRRELAGLPFALSKILALPVLLSGLA